MNEQKRNEIVGRWQAGASIRQIAHDLGLARNTVSKVLVQVARPSETATPTDRHRDGAPASSIVMSSSVEETVGSLSRVDRRATVGGTAQAGFPGGYTTVRQRLAELRPRIVASPRAPLRDGAGRPGPDGLFRLRHRLHRAKAAAGSMLFSYVLGYSRRQYRALRRVPGSGDHACASTSAPSHIWAVWRQPACMTI